MSTAVAVSHRGGARAPGERKAGEGEGGEGEGGGGEETGSQPEIAQAPGRATSFDQLAIEEASGFKASSFTPRIRG